MMSYGIRPPGKLNEAYVNMKTFTSPEVLKSVKIFTDFKASMVYAFFCESALSFCDVKWNAVMAYLYHSISSINKYKIQINFRCLNLNAQNQVS